MTAKAVHAHTEVLHNLPLGGQRAHKHKLCIPQPTSKCLPQAWAALGFPKTSFSIPDTPQLFSAGGRDAKTNPENHDTTNSRKGDLQTWATQLCYGGRQEAQPLRVKLSQVKVPRAAAGLPDLSPSSPLHNTAPDTAPYPSAELVLSAASIANPRASLLRPDK